ncbi:MAG: FAD-binding protein, partial [Nitrospinota bacterium]|nr:FAD-binding protein [Nitrospinota bacterium]
MRDWAADSLEKVSQTRAQRKDQPAPILPSKETDRLLAKCHPDRLGRKRSVSVGANADGQMFPPELADLLEAESPLPQNYSPQPELETDVLIIGGGGAGTAAALTLEGTGLGVHLATKLRLGDSNTVMAEGGIQAALGDNDSVARHFADSYVGGHGNNDTGLLRILCETGPDAIRWLTRLGCLFDQTENGSFHLRKGGGTSIPRVLACRDFTGLEIMRVLRDTLRQGTTHLLEQHAAIELLDNGKGQVTGAVFWNSETKKLLNVSARAVLLATGGSGQLRLQGFPTSNHLGATGD